jgi:7-keto-8-aminopelargonate synthetase-like enzyme
MGMLEKLLSREEQGNGKIIVSDGVFSMSGTLTPLVLLEKADVDQLRYLV